MTLHIALQELFAFVIYETSSEEILFKCKLDERKKLGLWRNHIQSFKVWFEPHGIRVKSRI